MRVLIPGISGGLARQVALRLLQEGHEVVGLDVRPWPDHPSDIELHPVDLRKRAAEDVFRRARPDAVLHMATVTAFTVQGEERHRINLGGTRAVFEHARAYGVKHAVFVGRHTFYGAGPDSALYHSEDEPPQALDAFPELADLVAADLLAANYLWRFPQLCTTVLRLCYTLGDSRTGTLATFLKGKRVPQVLGYDPLFQFMHEDDAVSALCLALRERLRGVYNVAGPPPLPLSVVIRRTGRTPVPLPEPLIRLLLGRAGFPSLPPGAVDHLKYPVVVDASSFARATGFRHRLDEVETLRLFR